MEFSITVVLSINGLTESAFMRMPRVMKKGLIYPQTVLTGLSSGLMKICGRTIIAMMAGGDTIHYLS